MAKNTLSMRISDEEDMPPIHQGLPRQYSTEQVEQNSRAEREGEREMREDKFKEWAGALQ